MNREIRIQAVNAAYNRALSEVGEPDASVQAELDELASVDPDLADQMQAAFRAASQPDTFFEESIWRVDERFEMAFELMRITFDPDVLDPRAGYVAWLKDRTEPLPDFIMMGRFWRASGRHRYSPEGRLYQFEFDPLVATESVASVIVGNYFSHESPALGQRVGIGAISYLATRPDLRGKGGHGKQLLAAFEAALKQRAEALDEPLRGIMLESEGRARGFWSKMGFRCAPESHYLQPPLNYDEETGEPTSNTAPETFMIKFADGSSPEQIDRAELLEWVHLLYERWYSPDLANQMATDRVRALVFDDLFGTFRDSLPADGAMIPLVALT